MAQLGPYIRTLDVPEPLRAPTFPVPEQVPVEKPAERELVPVRRKTDD